VAFRGSLFLDVINLSILLRFIFRQLERDRTEKSMPLKEEREILKQIGKAEKTKREVQEYNIYDKSIKDRKAKIVELRESLKTLNATAGALRTEVSLSNTAKKFGCNVEDLLGMKVGCPKNKIGNVIGRKGGTMKNIMETSNVSVVVDRDYGNITMLGSHEALDHACAILDRIISSTEKALDASPLQIKYFTAKSISAVTDLRNRHPDVVLTVPRANTQALLLRGLPTDIENAEKDLLSFTVIQKELRVASKLSAVVVGKQGATIERLVLDHQATIDIQRNKDDDSVITIVGPATNVEAAMKEIEEMIAAAKESTETVAIDQNLRSALLLKGGAGIRELNKKVSAVTKEHGNLSLSMGDDGIIVVGKVMVTTVAVEMLKEEICQLEATIVRIKVDPFALPVFIGKGGKTLQKLKDGKYVNVEIDRIVGEVTICGLDKSEVAIVEESFRSFAAENLVERVSVDSSVVKSLLRSKLGKEVSDLVFAASDEATSQILIRGTADNIKKASELIHAFLAKNFKQEIHLSENDMKTVLSGGKDSMVAKLSKEVGASLNSERDRNVIVAKGEGDKVKEAYERIHAFLAKNFTQEIHLSADDMKAVLAGGKNSMIANLSKEIGVKLNSERDRSVLLARGEVDKVKAAVDRVNRFLQGGEGLEVTRIALNEQLLGLVIGKRGKTMTVLQKNHDKISIIVDRVEHAVTLRGPPIETEDCRIEIMKLISAAQTTQTIDVTEEQRKELDRSRIARRVAQSLSVQIRGADGKINVRGAAPDVQYVVTLLNEHISGVYESRITLEESHFHKLSEACLESDHLHRIENCSGAKLVLDLTERALVVRGSRDKVKLAKTEIAKLLQFLFSPNFLLFEVPSPLVSAGRLPFSIADAMAISGATIQLDREIDSIYVSSVDSKKVERAAEILRPKIEAAEKLVFVLEIDAAEEWLISSIIGKNGSRVNSLRKELGCNIDVLSKERKITVTAENEEVVANARSTLEKVVDDARGGRAIVEIPEDDMAAFVGRSGAHINEFRLTYAVEVQVMKNQVSAVRLTGDEKAVLAAKDAVIEWLTARAQANVQASTTLQLKEYEVPAVIGTKGSVIRGLEEEFDCRVQIDRSELTVTISGGTSEKREGALNKINEILAGDSESEDVQATIILQLKEYEVPAIIGTKGSVIQGLREEFDCRVQIDQSELTVTIRGGTSENREGALNKIKEILSGDSETEEVQATITLQLKEYEVPAVIGTKGSVIQSLEEECGCRVQIDRSELTVTIHGGTSENREGALNKIKEILSGDSETEDAYSKTHDIERTSDEALAVENRTVPDRGQKTKQRRETSQPQSYEAVDSAPPLPSRPFVGTASDFPILTTPIKAWKAVDESKDNEEDSAGSTAETSYEKAKSVESGLSWASMVTKEKTQPRSLISMVSDAAWDESSYSSKEDNPEVEGRVEVKGFIVSCEH
jgi:rRNA processing protein Krr1/Pno1